MEKFMNGWWTAWLCDFKEGEQQTHAVDADNVKIIRAVISRLVKEGKYFSTKYNKGELKVERLTFEQWMETKKII